MLTEKKCCHFVSRIFVLLLLRSRAQNGRRNRPEQRASRVKVAERGLIIPNEQFEQGEKATITIQVLFRKVVVLKADQN